ncbi:CRISPR-associated autoregulator, Cst2 family [Trichormus variabilis ATCC 29413]|uniref:CRISPR-associated autoregulator, Cst2 family n=2 Tax=Anabaena variabilis TaxID=264691 RepID=Q3M7D7_TRIV2|nr:MULTISPECIES: DevR family CRISPR-associated autoregulator [Nostocaceae]ABA23099.1 CRISPR-associated autoregulator, Cst2 family [Trichormus variabilis ATCC 29413]MBC1214083.1 DevR family CRISPR-associated autoregulator [Trichormus variabilis ARAD]MBC1257309.1 DevR family CRISPR-associated autoregulator [Trichormus variabilis V5]MBC1270206.1 DevR family CRISPR-associated autoregulator [Trichormus variabilis FSR]MBC1303344.1 DevR family CRISPR-associated autoregulator [Trichormus variabilis N2
MFHLFGNILTSYGTAANNRGENEGNTTTLQKLIWKGEVHSTVSSEAIRWALRYYWQNAGYPVNRRWDENAQPVPDHILQDPNFDDIRFIDDDVLGFMQAEAAKVEAAVESEVEIQNSTQDEDKKLSQGKEKETAKRKRKEKPKGKITTRRGVLEVTRAVSTIPYAGDLTFNAMSGKKGRTSLYSTEVHATRYQYGFALTPNSLKDKSRINAVLDSLISIGEVAGNHARFLYDFSPDSIILRWTHDFSPRLLYCFEEDELRNISTPDLVRRVESGDIDPKELWIGGAISSTLEDLGANVFPGVKTTVEALKQVIIEDLQLSLRSS